LRAHIDDFIQAYNEHAKPFAWTKSEVYLCLSQIRSVRIGDPIHDYATNGLDGARNRRVLVQGQVRARPFSLSR
jgi:hypothetical protein